MDRLTEAKLRKAEARGKVEGWYKLCREGYIWINLSPPEMMVRLRRMKLKEAKP